MAIRIVRSKKFRRAILKKYNSCCAYCGKELTYETLQIDHIIPFANDDSSNLNPCCRSCNSAKGIHNLKVFRRMLTRKALKIPSFNKNQKSFLLRRFNVNIDQIVEANLVSFYFENINESMAEKE